MEIQGVLSALDGLAVRGMDFGLKRTRALLDGLSSPDEKLKIIHIAGSNGKGSVAEFISRILIAAGKKTGVFTSPEVFGYFGQFRIDGQELGEELFVKAFGDALRAGAGLNATRFETETAGALHAFALAGCEYAVVECGLGGLEDATNAIRKKEIAVITSICLEHTAILGDKITDICRHKAGIIKNCPAVVSGCVSGAAREYFEKLGVTFAEKSLSEGFEITAVGDAQRYNAATAIAVARALKIDESAIYSGVKAAYPEGRLQKITTKSGVYILDGAHNPQAFKPLAEYIKSLGVKVKLVYGCLSDKDIDGCLSRLTGLVSEAVAVKPDSPRAMDIREITRACVSCFDKVKVKSSVADALEYLKACGGDVPTVICGSFTLLKESLKRIEKGL